MKHTLQEKNTVHTQHLNPFMESYQHSIKWGKQYLTKGRIFALLLRMFIVASILFALFMIKKPGKIPGFFI